MASIQPGGRLATDLWAEKARSLIDATRGVILSKRFEAIVASHDELRESAEGATAPGLVLAAAYLGVQPRRSMLPTWITVGGKDLDVPAETALCDALSYAQVRVAPLVLRRWASTSPVTRSCAVNTIAHELTHTVVDRSAAGRQMFTDRGYRLAQILGHKFVSYGVGTIAQCTYLERNAHQSERDLALCLHTWGLSSFKDNGCQDADDAPDDPALTALGERGTPICTVQTIPGG